MILCTYALRFMLVKICQIMLQNYHLLLFIQNKMLILYLEIKLAATTHI